MALEAGTKLGHYEVVSSLGEGGMGEVYRAKDPVSTAKWRSRSLPEAVSADPERLARFERSFGVTHLTGSVPAEGTNQIVSGTGEGNTTFRHLSI